MILKGEKRAKLKQKKIHGPGGGTLSGFANRVKVNQGYLKNKRHSKVVIVDKT